MACQTWVRVPSAPCERAHGCVTCRSHVCFSLQSPPPCSHTHTHRACSRCCRRCHTPPPTRLLLTPMHRRSRDYITEPVQAAGTQPLRPDTHTAGGQPPAQGGRRRGGQRAGAADVGGVRRCARAGGGVAGVDASEWGEMAEVRGRGGAVACAHVWIGTHPRGGNDKGTGAHHCGLCVAEAALALLGMCRGGLRHCAMCVAGLTAGTAVCSAANPGHAVCGAAPHSVNVTDCCDDGRAAVAQRWVTLAYRNAWAAWHTLASAKRWWGERGRGRRRPGKGTVVGHERGGGGSCWPVRWGKRVRRGLHYRLQPRPALAAGAGRVGDPAEPAAGARARTRVHVHACAGGERGAAKGGTAGARAGREGGLALVPRKYEGPRSRPKKRNAGIRRRAHTAALRVGSRVTDAASAVDRIGLGWIWSWSASVLGTGGGVGVAVVVGVVVGVGVTVEVAASTMGSALGSGSGLWSRSGSRSALESASVLGSGSASGSELSLGLALRSALGLASALGTWLALGSASGCR
eukprot:363740-Chlamydomonas_euryale.AAC.15